MQAPDTIRSDLDLSAAVHLPHGAVVTEVRAWVDDSSPDSDVRIDLMRRTLVDGDADQMATTSSSGVQAGVRQLATSSIAGATVDNQNHAYYVNAAWSTAPTAAAAERLALYAVRIAYTVSSPGP
jgi:hypothetical protein